MKCPNCGALMKDGHMYCEKCGREIQIVPEFEPEIENSIHATLSNVATEIMAPKKEGTRTQQDKGWSKTEQYRKKKRFFGYLLIPILICVIAAILVLLHFVPGFQYSKALYYARKDQYQKALSPYERAVELSPRNLTYLNGLAECYTKLGDYESAENVCLEMIALEGSNQDAYKRIVQIYEKLERYDDINRLMQNCMDREIITQYLDYMANPPEFNMKGGTYQESIDVKLIGNTVGTIYYTLDGSVPDESSEIYTNPIEMNAGSFTIKAFFVNQYGSKSEIVTQQYWIEVTRPEAPAVTPESGNYLKPVQISIEVPEGCQIFYTTDKTDPDKSSTLYEGPFWMPVGYSTFRFVTVSPGGVIGEITEKKYTLNLRPVLSIEAAANRLMLTLKNAGLIKDLQGNLSDKAGKNLYTYKYALTINENHYYYFREYYEETTGISNATGRDFVVNYTSGECYQAQLQMDKSYKLFNIESALQDGV